MRRTYQALYRLGVTPWDTARVPAPLATAIQALPPGTAVDLGCGTGRQARYLAAHGWSVTAIDYVARAIESASERDPGGLVTWRAADVTATATADPGGRLAGTATLILDNGCLHGIPAQHHPGWARTVNHLAAPRCTLLIRAAPRRAHRIGPDGIDPPEITALLGTGWHQDPSPEPGWHHYTRAAPDDGYAGQAEGAAGEDDGAGDLG